MKKWAIRLLSILLILNFSYLNLFAEDGKIIIMGQKVPNIKFKHTGGALQGLDVVDDDTLAYFKPSNRDIVKKKWLLKKICG